MAFTEILNGDTGLSARTTINEITTYLNRLGLDIEFSADNSAWHYGWASGDLYMRFSSDFGATWSDGIYLNYSASGASGWTSVVWDNTTGNLNFYKDAVLDETVNIDGRYALTAAAQQTVFTITLPNASTVAARIAAATEGTDYPTGWVLTAGSSPTDIDIEHGLSRYAANATVFVNTGSSRQLLIGSSGFSGVICDDDDNVRLQSLSTIPKEITIYLIFA